MQKACSVEVSGKLRLSRNHPRTEWEKAASWQAFSSARVACFLLYTLRYCLPVELFDFFISCRSCLFNRSSNDWKKLAKLVMNGAVPSDDHRDLFALFQTRRNLEFA